MVFFVITIWSRGVWNENSGTCFRLLDRGLDGDVWLGSLCSGHIFIFSGSHLTTFTIPSEHDESQQGANRLVEHCEKAGKCLHKRDLPGVLRELCCSLSIQYAAYMLA